MGHNDAESIGGTMKGGGKRTSSKTGRRLTLDPGSARMAIRGQAAVSLKKGKKRPVNLRQNNVFGVLT